MTSHIRRARPGPGSGRGSPLPGPVWSSILRKFTTGASRALPALSRPTAPRRPPRRPASSTSICGCATSQDFLSVAAGRPARRRLPRSVPTASRVVGSAGPQPRGFLRPRRSTPPHHSCATATLAQSGAACRLARPALPWGRVLRNGADPEAMSACRSGVVVELRDLTGGACRHASPTAGVALVTLLLAVFFCGRQRCRRTSPSDRRHLGQTSPRSARSPSRASRRAALLRPPGQRIGRLGRPDEGRAPRSPAHYQLPTDLVRTLARARATRTELGVEIRRPDYLLLRCRRLHDDLRRSWKPTRLVGGDGWLFRARSPAPSPDQGGTVDKVHGRRHHGASSTPRKSLPGHPRQACLAALEVQAPARRDDGAQRPARRARCSAPASVSASATCWLVTSARAGALRLRCSWRRGQPREPCSGADQALRHRDHRLGYAVVAEAGGGSSGAGSTVSPSRAAPRARRSVRVARRDAGAVPADILAARGDLYADPRSTPISPPSSSAPRRFSLKPPRMAAPRSISRPPLMRERLPHELADDPAAARLGRGIHAMEDEIAPMR